MAKKISKITARITQIDDTKWLVYNDNELEKFKEEQEILSTLNKKALANAKKIHDKRLKFGPLQPMDPPELITKIRLEDNDYCYSIEAAKHKAYEDGYESYICDKRVIKFREIRDPKKMRSNLLCPTEITTHSRTYW